MRSPASATAVFFLAVLPALPAHAHDFWIEPSTYRPEVVSTVRLHLKVGEELAGEPVVRRAEKVERFWAVAPGGRAVDAPAPEGMDPAGLLRIEAPGRWVVAYRSKRSSIELDAATFTEYLEHEGLERVRDLRAERGLSAERGREVYSRCAKTVVAAGDEALGDVSSPLGLPLELVPERDPYELVAGDALPLRLLFDGDPVAGALVAARAAADPARRLTARSDADGRVAFDLDHGGAWLVSAVHMVEAPAELDADWESFWASLTFDLQ